MQINLAGHHVEITDSLRSYVDSKFDKVERFFDRINTADVLLNIEKLDHIAEATLYVSQNKIYAKAQSENMYAAIDSLSHKLIKQLTKHKDKLNHH